MRDSNVTDSISFDTVKMSGMSDEKSEKKGYYLLSANVFCYPLRQPRFSTVKSFSAKELESMTVAELTRILVEEIIVDGVNLISSKRKCTLRYGDDKETEVVYEGEESSEGSRIRSISLSLPLEDHIQNHNVGFLHPRDRALDFLALARTCGSSIPVCIFVDGPKFSKAKHSSILTLKLQHQLQDLYESEEEEDEQEPHGLRLQDSYATVSHEDKDEDSCCSFNRHSPRHKTNLSHNQHVSPHSLPTVLDSPIANHHQHRTKKTETSNINPPNLKTFEPISPISPHTLNSPPTQDTN